MKMKTKLKRIKRWFGSFLHNSIAHALLPFLPRKIGDRFHDWTVQFYPPYDDF